MANRLRWVALAMVALAVVACGDDTATTTTGPAVVCEKPPDEDQVSQLDLRLDPNPVASGAVAQLVMTRGDLPDDAVIGVDAWWQCWVGGQWVTTHVIYRGFGDSVGQSIPVNDNFQIQVPDIGLTLDTGYPIAIPRVEPGTYRIEDAVFLEDGQTDGFVLVEVTDH